MLRSVTFGPMTLVRFGVVERCYRWDIPTVSRRSDRATGGNSSPTVPNPVRFWEDQMNLHSKCYRAVGLTAIVCVMCLAAVGQTAASLNSKRNQPLVHGPALRTEESNYSFRGLQVPVGQTSSAIEIPITNGGDVPLTGIAAEAHGDFFVTGTSCSSQLPAGDTEKSRCVIS